MKKSELIFTAILVPVDFLMLILAALAAYFLRFTPFVKGVRPVIFDLSLQYYFNIVFFIALAWLIIFAFSGLYSTKSSSHFIDEFYRIFSSCSGGIMLILVVIFARRELFSSRFIVLAGWIFSIIFVFIGRFLIHLIRQEFFRKGIGVNNLLVIGDDKTAKNIIQLIKNNSSFGARVIKEFNNCNEKLIKRISNFIKNNQVNEILLCANLNEEISLQLVDFCNDHNIVYKYVPNLFEAQAVNVDVQYIAGIPIIELKRTPLDGWGKIFKRIFDVIGSIFAIIVFSPIMLLTASAIKFDSKGPIFFGYKRIGQYGKPFFYFKFRSMIKQAHQMRYDPKFRNKVEDIRGWNNDNPMIKYKNDPRITKVGKFIRKYSIDELPEFFNVLIGKMSLVGPRPHEPEEVAKYKKYHKKVLTIKPGMTGIAQISGRSDLSFNEETRLDIYYIEKWSIKMDLYILFRTPFILFKKRKAE
ncbi:MAG: exopolysaccharide biosynthesis polyprenyl glycosylphosphotransferase [Xanthomonadaceae bacterium]|nr:exopolysaccharide biosynthesis polyprenyl glycosylphosphotransferase [Rhodospirillaceae bacterium]NIA17835.1 exopolysaccharide biosynthesis polyprenyl glycosylphosphotransferase [Xanthomonadaceae bacterium]